MNITKAREDLRLGKTISDMNLRVCYYARVSTDKDDQLNSLENQKSYFEDMISENKNWKYVSSYIDEGISGTRVKNRDNFLRMIEDSKHNKIDLILTKEISRFSRNTVDSIKYTEELLRNGVIVYFLSDNLNTIYEDSEFRLTIMSSLAQDEVRKISERVKFGINRMIKDRKLIGSNLTGYYKVNGKYQINPKEEPIIKYLFESYVSSNKSLKQIGIDLKYMGYLNSKGMIYSQNTLSKMLTNPRYKGFYTARLTKVDNYKTHKKVKVEKENQIIERNINIPKIVSEELWDKANKLYESRKRKRSRNILNSQKSFNNKYSSKLICDECKNVFLRNSGGTRNIPVWACKTYRTKGVDACLSPIIKENILDEIFINIFNEIINLEDITNEMILDYEKIITLNNNLKEINRINKEKDKILDLNIKGILNDLEFKARNDKYNIELNKLHSDSDILSKNDKLNNIKENLFLVNSFTNRLPDLINLLIDNVVVKKINSSRKKINLNIYFTFNKDVYHKNIKL